MTSLWTQLFQRPRYNAYARLDADGKCLAFKQCSQSPSGIDWVQISEIQLAWLGRELPIEARVCARANRRWHQRLLAA
ncbi:hypothetical protein ACF8FG_25510 [Pseudomonas sp. YQ_6]|uniref:hypothetical protein n=1 Tax=Pseudomonas TaxID=286 RepID=UPI00106F6C1A|nr:MULTISPECIES: hypothetical protein [Pseudomonas]MDW2774877.1 hypothetical protein [Pseudomonas sp. BEA3.1]TFF52253.1 hypothetical protein C5609_09810 [Pseudomonas putida]